MLRVSLHADSTVAYKKVLLIKGSETYFNILQFTVTFVIQSYISMTIETLIRTPPSTPCPPPPPPTPPNLDCASFHIAFIDYESVGRQSLRIYSINVKIS